EHARGPGGAGREQRAQRPRRGTEVLLAFFLDQDVLEGEVAVAGEVDVPEVVTLEDPGTLGPDVDGGGDGIRPRELATNLRKPRDRASDLSRLPERSEERRVGKEGGCGRSAGA